MPRLAAPILLLLTVSCGSPRSQDDSSGLWIGGLLSFTGALAAGAADYERAMILAQEAVNESGGVASRKLQLRMQDTHSDLTRGMSAARQAIDDDSILALVGPDAPHLISSLAPMIDGSGLSEMLPGITAPPILGDDENHWFRILPAARVTGCAWAQRLYEDGAKRVVILHENDAFSSDLAAGVVTVFIQMPDPSQKIVANIAFDPVTTDPARVLASVYETGADAVVLIAGAKAGAALVNEWSGPAAMPFKWYLGPSLNTDEFVVNTRPGELEGMTGIAAAVPEATGAAFRAAYSKRWRGEAPSVSAYAYYDAVALLALAAESASYAAGGPPSRQEIRDHIERVSRPPGKTVTWNELGKGLALLRAGVQVNYQGASGPVDLTSSGAIDTAIALFRFWTVVNGEIVPTEFGSCVWLAEGDTP